MKFSKAISLSAAATAYTVAFFALFFGGIYRLVVLGRTVEGLGLIALAFFLLLTVQFWLLND